MSSEKQDALAARERALEILKPLIDHDLADVLACVAWEQTDLSGLTSERSKDAPQNFPALTETLFREGQFKVTQANAAQSAVQKINQPHNRDSGSAGQRTRQRPDKLNQYPCQRVFESVAQGKGDGSRGEFSMSNECREIPKENPTLRNPRKVGHPQNPVITCARSLPTSPGRS